MCVLSHELLLTPVLQPSGADQAAVTLGTVDGKISGLTISDPPTQAEVQALRDKGEELTDSAALSSTTVDSRPYMAVLVVSLVVDLTT